MDKPANVPASFLMFSNNYERLGQVTDFKSVGLNTGG